LSIPSGQNPRKGSLSECIFDTLTDCFFGDFAHWVDNFNLALQFITPAKDYWTRKQYVSIDLVDVRHHDKY